MMSNTINDNKRIAKNTIYLYARMLLMLVVSLYTSRVVLHVLGIDNYGIYNAVSGIIVMFSFVNGALTTGTQRHISFELGKPDKDVAKIFTACLNTHLFMSIIFLLFSETLGLWFVNTQMNFPDGRMFAVNWVYQIAVLSTITGIIRTPYEATIIAYERMDFYAYTGVIEALLKLALVFVLTIIEIDKLIAYSNLMFLTTILMFVAFIVYVRKQFDDVRYVSIKDKTIYKYIVSFSSWTLFGAFTGVLETQGMSVIINIAWGVALNAAVGVATQVRSALYQFVTGFQKALSPQLVISESSGNESRQIDLIFKASRFSFFLMYVMVVPLVANLPYILRLWLGTVPDFAYQICALMLFISLMECLSYSLYTTIFAIGKIKEYQVLVAVIRLISVITAYLLSKTDVMPYLIYVIPCMSSVALLIYRVVYLKKIKGLSINAYLRNVIYPIILVAVLSITPIVFYKKMCIYDSSITLLLAETIIIVAWIGSVVMLCGMKKSERELVVKALYRIIRKQR